MRLDWNPTGKPHEPPSEFVEGSAETRADILLSAARWCLFWAERGHGMEPWF